MSNYVLTEEDKTVLRGLRKVGCAVCVFMPDEMPHSDPEDVEDAMCSAGWDKINYDTPDGEPISA